METRTSSREDTKADSTSVCTEPARLDKYNILELARLPSITIETRVENWLESIYGKTTAPSQLPPAGSGSITALAQGSNKLLETCNNRDHSPTEARALASRPPTSTERSAVCDVDSTFIERKGYKWRKWATESV